ncbi:MAG: DUF1549 domain-containing protein, partial [Limisphaerales bacterium]
MVRPSNTSIAFYSLRVALFLLLLLPCDAATNDVWWSLRPLTRPEIPSLASANLPANPIDRFLLAKLEATGLNYSAVADRRTLVRRLYFDLIGLPPRPEEVQEFLRDETPRAYERLVDRLLGSAQYG